MRKEITVTLNDRGNELTFRIREMPATKVERWIIKLAGALSATGVFSADVADGVDAQKAIADFLLKGGLSKLGAVTKDYDEVIQPLIDELYTCVEQKVGNAYFALTPDVIDAKIEDVRTLFNLQKEIVKVAPGFFRTWRGLELYSPPAPRGFRAAETENISPLISPLIINHYATLAELQTVYDYEDVFLMLECIRVDSYNQWAINKAAEREAQHGSIC